MDRPDQGRRSLHMLLHFWNELIIAKTWAANELTGPLFAYGDQHSKVRPFFWESFHTKTACFHEKQQKRALLAKNAFRFLSGKNGKFVPGHGYCHVALSC